MVVLNSIDADLDQRIFHLSIGNFDDTFVLWDYSDLFNDLDSIGIRDQVNDYFRNVSDDTRNQIVSLITNCVISGNL
jgi:hypothetical protein